jgi:predicted ABC-type ATPase
VSQKRLRIFAGPNGSGKSSLLDHIPKEVPLGYYINADEIEKLIISAKGINLKAFGVSPDINDLHRFLKKSDFARKKSDIKKLVETFTISGNILQTVKTNLLPAYTAAIISDFIREENLKSGNDFSFETVMSHPDKLEFLKRAVLSEYHVYLYFISTDDVRVNIERVKTRVKNGGHDVPEDKIKNRYFRSLDLLYDALKICYKSYLFDNSDNTLEIARIDRDKIMYFSVNEDKVPNWLIKYVIAKSDGIPD